MGQAQSTRWRWQRSWPSWRWGSLCGSDCSILPGVACGGVTWMGLHPVVGGGTALGGVQVPGASGDPAAQASPHVWCCLGHRGCLVLACSLHEVPGLCPLSSSYQCPHLGHNFVQEHNQSHPLSPFLSWDLPLPAVCLGSPEALSLFALPGLRLGAWCRCVTDE